MERTKNHYIFEFNNNKKLSDLKILFIFKKKIDFDPSTQQAKFGR